MEGARFNVMLKKKGVIDFQTIYGMVPDYFGERRFFVPEDHYRQKKGSLRGREIEVKFSGFRKIDEYKQYDFEVLIYIDNAVEVEVEKDGEKKKMIEGECRVRNQMKLTTDWQKKFKTPFKQKLKKFYDVYIIKFEMIARVAELYRDLMIPWNNKVKKVLELEGA